MLGREEGVVQGLTCAGMAGPQKKMQEDSYQRI